MSQNRPRPRSQPERNLTAVHEFRHGGKSCGKVNRIAEVRNRDRGAKFHRHPRHKRGGGRQYAAIFQIIVGPDLRETELGQIIASFFREPD